MDGITRVRWNKIKGFPIGIVIWCNVIVGDFIFQYFAVPRKSWKEPHNITNTELLS